MESAALKRLWFVFDTRRQAKMSKTGDLLTSELARPLGVLTSLDQGPRSCGQRER